MGEAPRRHRPAAEPRGAQTLWLVALLLAACTGEAPSESPLDAGAPHDEESLRTEVVVVVKVTGDGRDVRIELPLPANDERQSIEAESFRLRGFALEETTADGNRTAVLTHPALTGSRRVTYKAEVVTRPRTWTVTSPAPGTEPPPHLHRWVIPTPRLQARSPAVRERLIRSVEPRLRDGETDLVRLVYQLVSSQFERKTGKGGTANVLRAIRISAANDRGLDRLFVTFLRTAQVPARTVGGFELGRAPGRKLTHWTEVNLDGTWVPFSVPEGWYGSLPADRLRVYHGDRRFLRREGVASLTFKLLVRDPRETVLPSPPAPDGGAAERRP